MEKKSRLEKNLDSKKKIESEKKSLESEKNLDSKKKKFRVGKNLDSKKKISSGKKSFKSKKKFRAGKKSRHQKKVSTPEKSIGSILFYWVVAFYYLKRKFYFYWANVGGEGGRGQKREPENSY